ncbi:hypothetical protein H2200_013294 [Cladophialophora chaetospira]|uniref:GRAM domain-containing protein n=1 Tax=Cladophialophora chaetospira TaxID=386627 RepID=A0AA38WW14_9EURO|nr:hypothetical protein H2200_013294 [Cladophialophora chaetospira]
MTSGRRNSLTETEQHIDQLLDSAIHARDRLKTKTKQLLYPTQSQPSSDDEDDIFSDAAFDPAQVLNQSSPKRNRPVGQAIRDELKSAAYLAAHPRRVMRSKATRIAADKLGRRHPLLSLDRDQELLDAHDAFSQAVSSNTSGTSDLEDALSELDEAHNRVQKVEEHRESLQTAWIMSRHVSRVKVVRPVLQPIKSHFKNGDRFEWERYLGYLALYYTRNFTSSYIDDFESPPFDLEDLARIIERIAITSAPWQTFLINLRRIYMWQDPKRTMKWLGLFSVLWYTQHIMAFFYFFVIYSTLRNRFKETSVRTVRESVGRSVDREARVQAWGELIQRHGQQDWLEPLLDEVGPMIQLQLGDLADLLEVLVNFHRWERPELTLASLFFFLCCLLVTLCADMDFCMKLVWLIAGSGFFLTYPLATNFPKYRLLLSHWRWMFWNVPTHSELGILSLQEKGASKNRSAEQFEHKQKESPMEQKAAHSEYAFRVHDQVEGKCRLVVYRTYLVLHAKSGTERTFPFMSLSEIRKLEDDEVHLPSSVKILKHLHSRSAEVLQFIFIDNNNFTILLHPADRDRLFNLVIAWSGLKWQSLRMERHITPDSKRRNLDRAIKRALR